MEVTQVKQHPGSRLSVIICAEQRSVSRIQTFMDNLNVLVRHFFCETCSYLWSFFMRWGFWWCPGSQVSGIPVIPLLHWPVLVPKPNCKPVWNQTGFQTWEIGSQPETNNSWFLFANLSDMFFSFVKAKVTSSQYRAQIPCCGTALFHQGILFTSGDYWNRQVWNKGSLAYFVQIPVICLVW